MSARRRSALLGLVAAAVVAVAGSAWWALAPSNDGLSLPLRNLDGSRPNVLLLTVDTLRADHLGAYGYSLPTSPNIDAIANGGIVFENAFTPVPTTAPALASMITGRHVSAHRVNANHVRLPDSLETVAESFSVAGYSTAAFYGNLVIKDGFGQGFATFQSYEGRDDVGAQQAAAWIEQAMEPWFVWVHLRDPHAPYEAWPAALSADLQYPERSDWDRNLPIGEDNSGFGAVPLYASLGTDATVGDYVRRYDGEIIGTDSQIGVVREAVARSGQTNDTLVLFSSDHGESMGENDHYFQHGWVLNEASLRIPFIVSHPLLPRGERRAQQASLIDLFPTLASLVGIGLPPDLPGADLTPALLSNETTDRTLIAYTVTPNRLVAARRGKWKAVITPTEHSTAGDAAVRIGLWDAETSEERQADAAELATFEELKDAAEDARAAIATGFLQRPEYSSAQVRYLQLLGYVD